MPSLGGCGAPEVFAAIASGSNLAYTLIKKEPAVYTKDCAFSKILEMSERTIDGQDVLVLTPMNGGDESIPPGYLEFTDEHDLQYMGRYEMVGGMTANDKRQIVEHNRDTERQCEGYE